MHKTMTKLQFIKLLPAIREAARGCGYAIGVHGSLKRDFDLIAVAWVESAKSPVELSEAIFEAANGKRWRFIAKDGAPFGRLWTAFDWGFNGNKEYCDLSIIPPMVL